MEKLAQAEQAETAAMGRDFDRLHGWRLTPDAPTTHNRFHDVGASHQRVILTDS
jgi:hypothetical protein